MPEALQPRRGRRTLSKCVSGIPPGENQTYEFSIPQDHRGGTYWYHPHVHHLVARQLWAGLAGLLIVRGELDDIPEIRDADEEFLVLKDFGLDANLDLLMPDPTPQIMQGREGNLVLVNGELNPTFRIPKDGLLRLRFLNASVARYYRLQLEDHPMYLIVTDGGPIAEPFECANCSWLRVNVRRCWSEANGRPDNTGS
jgi:FtsP/CotA-like multicopper oxidase with cupredoxin domain